MALKKINTTKSKKPKLNIEASLFKDYPKQWIEWCKTGKHTGKPNTPRTIEIKKVYFQYFLRRVNPEALESGCSILDIAVAIGSYEVEAYSSRQKMYDTLMSFTAFLVFIGKLDPVFRDELKKIRPKRLYPARRTIAREKHIKKLLKTLWKETRFSQYSKILITCIVILIYNCGPRREEVLNIKIKDIDFERAELIISLGKGYKTRRLGLNKKTIFWLRWLLKHRPTTDLDRFFILENGKKLSKETFSQQFRRLTNRAGLDLTSHGLRRGFVSKNVENGVSLISVSRACGHADISTTQKSYYIPDEEKMINDMKHW
jgi:integrase